ncbi:MAG: RNA methyltransferase [Bdellovibrionota bacterium]
MTFQKPRRPSFKKSFDRPAKKSVDDYRAEKKAKAAVLDNWIWGEHSVEVCAETQPENLLEIFIENAAAKHLSKITAKLGGLKVSPVEKLPRFLTEKRTQGIAAKVKSFPVFHENDFFETEVTPKSQVLILDRVQDPQNFGAILRSAAALGANSIFIGRREQAPVNGTVALVSAGNLFKVKIYTATNLSRTCERLQEKGFTVFALVGGSKDLTQCLAESKAENVAWVLGAEEDGIQPNLAKTADQKVGIPMFPGVESLNVSNSAAIALYEAYKHLKS